MFFFASTVRLWSRIGNKAVVLVLCCGLLQACSVSISRDTGPPPGSIDVSSIPDAVPRVEPRSKYGNPGSYVVNGKRYYVKKSSKDFVQRGIASWYGNKFHGRRTSNGETYDMYAMSAAHKTLPLPTYLEVVNLKNGRKVIVRVNDRGPFHENRIIDLSYTAAAKLGIVKTGTGLVEIRAINPGTYKKGGAPVRTAAIDTVSSGFYIQVGSFSSILNAKNLRKKLGPLGSGLIHISKAVLHGSTVYRVRIGPIQDIDFADRIVTGLGRYGITEHHIVFD